MSETKITQGDLENPQRFIGEGLGAPEARIISGGSISQRDGLVHQNY